MKARAKETTRLVTVFEATHPTGLQLIASGPFGPEAAQELDRVLGPRLTLFQRVTVDRLLVEAGDARASV